MFVFFFFFAANSEALKGQMVNPPPLITFGVSHLSAWGETGLLERSQLYWTSFTLPVFPSMPLTPTPPHPALKLRDSLVSYIPSVSWFLWVCVKGKAPSLFFFFSSWPRMWHHGNILTAQLDFREKIRKLLAKTVDLEDQEAFQQVTWSLMECGQCSWRREQNKSIMSQRWNIWG